MTCNRDVRVGTRQSVHPSPSPVPCSSLDLDYGFQWVYYDRVYRYHLVFLLLSLFKLWCLLNDSMCWQTPHEGTKVDSIQRGQWGASSKSGKLKGDYLQGAKKEPTQIKPKWILCWKTWKQKRKRTTQTSSLVLLVPKRHEDWNVWRGME